MGWRASLYDRSGPAYPLDLKVRQPVGNAHAAPGYHHCHAHSYNSAFNRDDCVGGLLASVGVL